MLSHTCWASARSCSEEILLVRLTLRRSSLLGPVGAVRTGEVPGACSLPLQSQAACGPEAPAGGGPGAGLFRQGHCPSLEPGCLSPPLRGGRRGKGSHSQAGQAQRPRGALGKLCGRCRAGEGPGERPGAEGSPCRGSRLCSQDAQTEGRHRAAASAWQCWSLSAPGRSSSTLAPRTAAPLVSQLWAGGGGLLSEGEQQRQHPHGSCCVGAWRFSNQG